MARISHRYSNINSSPPSLIIFNSFFRVRKVRSHLIDGVYVRLAVQTAYPPPLQGFVVSRPQRDLPLEGGAIAGL